MFRFPTIDGIELRRRKPSRPFIALAAWGALACAVGACALVLKLAGGDIVAATASFASLGTRQGLAEVLVVLAPLLLVSLGVAIARKVAFWNVGGDGQFLVGATAAICISNIMSPLHAVIGCLMMGSAAFFAAGVVSVAVAVLKLTRRADEVLMTLMLNFVAVYFVAYLVAGPLQDPDTQWIQSAPVPEGLRLSRIAGFGRANASLVLALIAFLVLWCLERWTMYDAAFRLAGENPFAVRTQRMSPHRMVLLAAFISGGLCGLAGYCELAGVQHRLIQDLSPGYGYFGLLVALLARGRFLPTLIITAVFSAIITGIDGATRMSGVPSYAITMILGCALVVHVALSQLGAGSLHVRRRSGE